jgi:regulatory protein
MARAARPRVRPPLDEAALRALASAYAARFQTTRARLAAYLGRKLAERGWAGEGEPPVAAIVERQAQLGAVDDAAWARARAEGLARRGLGARRVRAALAAGGIAPGLREPLAAAADPLAAAEAYARRRRLGRFRAGGPGDRDRLRRDLAAMLRAGHGFEAALAALGSGPGAADPDEAGATDDGWPEA